jgi:hypothetical protein
MRNLSEQLAYIEGYDKCLEELSDYLDKRENRLLPVPVNEVLDFVIKKLKLNQAELTIIKAMNKI